MKITHQNIYVLFYNLITVYQLLLCLFFKNQICRKKLGDAVNLAKVSTQTKQKLKIRKYSCVSSDKCNGVEKSKQF